MSLLLHNCITNFIPTEKKNQKPKPKSNGFENWSVEQFQVLPEQIGQTGIYIPPQNANYLHVQLWGAGGGGGGCSTLSAPSNFAVGGGGGGGGYAEAYIQSPLESSYDYFVSTGGQGGTGGPGFPADLSWFWKISNVPQVSCTGGGGGGTAMSSNSMVDFFASGGRGGVGGGPKAQIKCEGSSGSDGSFANAFAINSGSGGAGAYASGGTTIKGTNPNVIGWIPLGDPGFSIGGGGGGTYISQMAEASSNGGLGADGHLLISAFIHSIQ